MNKLIAFLIRLHSRLTRPVEAPEEDAFSRHATLGDMMAQYTLAMKYETGRGVKQSYSEACKWYRKSAEQGHMGAKQKLKSLGKTDLS